MSYLLELNQKNRSLLANAFAGNKRVDYSIECVVEGHMGRAFADCLEHPTAFRIQTGPFWYYAGDATSPGGQELLCEFPPHHLLMPSPREWIEAAYETFGDRLVPLDRYSFSPNRLSEGYLADLFAKSRHCDGVVPLDEALIGRITAQTEGTLEIGEFGSPASFLERGLGFTALDGKRVMGVAYSALVCSRGIEVSIYVEERYRRIGVATALASRLLLECLRRGLRPNWDAANPESCKLALKLGFTFLESYEVYSYAPA